MREKKNLQVHSVSFQKRQHNGLPATHEQEGFLALKRASVFSGEDKLFVVYFSYKKRFIGELLIFSLTRFFFFTCTTPLTHTHIFPVTNEDRKRKPAECKGS